MAKRVSAAAVRAVTAFLALAPPALLYQIGWLTVPKLSTDQLRAWVHQPLTAGFVAMLGYAGAGALWVLLMAAVTDHAHRYLTARLRWHLTLHLPGPLQALAAALLGTTAITTAAALPAVAHDHTAADTDPPPADRAAPIHDAPVLPPPGDPSPSPRGLTATSATATTALPTPTIPDTTTESARHASPPVFNRTGAHPPSHAPREKVRVVAGDNLWDLAAEHLGDATRWREIYALNRGHRQTNGYALTNPNTIHVGWKLTLPAHQATPTPALPRPKPPAAGNSGHAIPKAETSPSAPLTPHTSTGPHRSTPHTTTPSTPADTAPTTPPAQPHAQPYDETETVLPARGWISLGLAAAIAAVAALLRLQRRRRARLTFPTSVSTAPQRSPIPPSLAPVDIIGNRHLGPSSDHQPASPALAAPIGVDSDGTEVSLFHLPGPGSALHGDGAVPAARAILASVLTSGAVETATARPVVVTTTDLLAQLLPEDAPAVGLDPDGTAYDGERLIVLADTAAAITHAEEEMIGRRRLLDTFDAETITDLNARTDHAETQPPYVLLIDSSPRHAPRLQAVATHRAALNLHPVILGPHDGIPTIEITAKGTTTGYEPHPATRLSTLGADDLAAVLSMLTDAIARPEAGTDVDDPPAEISPTAVTAEPNEAAPPQADDAAALVRLRVLGPVTVATDAGPIATGMRSGSYTALAVLAAHPAGRTLDQLAADLHPHADPAAAIKRVRTDITSARRVLRAATGHEEPMFIVYDPATGRYQLDPQTVTVDLWQMLTAIDQATTTDDEAAMLTALRRATELYAGDFAEGHDHTWATDYATSYRHQILTAYARIAEILEPDHPDQAVAALEHAAELDPVNEELYQRIMRIHGRQQRPDAVRRTLRRLEERLADLGDAEPSQATRRVAERQLRPVAPASGGRP
ncbi:BTAD domain-containing putative transcriptional regulator [Micromonospora sp. S-DT3-3-22]|uniref:BTAD domain-containing putative transcriptional regulator n=1 Tax=Micromonospora sp. S-DT3-3-22 TaxID=2755359 RepID=UPI00188DD161|nr:BTAD domain-containing putative transcriptional regulator [Micromonospora sp. S-DT3-3-22]